MAKKPVKDELNDILGEALPKKKSDAPLAADKPPRDPPRSHALALVIFACLLLIVSTVIFLTITPGPSALDPQGKFTSPKSGSNSFRSVTISGYTKNLPLDRPYVIIAVDVEKLRLSWPKRPFIKPDTRFQTTINEEGPAGTCVVSLYAVNRDHYEKINQWFKEQQFSGIPLLPGRYRLDSISLKIKGVKRGTTLKN